MIVRDRPSGLRLFCCCGPSRSASADTAVQHLLATAVTLAHGNLFTFKITLTPIPFT